MTLVYTFGSGECEQLGLGDEAPSEIKKPRRLQIFELGSADFAAKSIVRVSCGGMHTVALASNGTLYSWGCNDDGALGRLGQENLPMRVDGALDIPVTGISTGDCHSIAYNTELNTVFYWGCYRDVISGQSTGKVQVPTKIAQEVFNDGSKIRIKKIVSGAQHTVALTQCKKVYAWGDADSGKIGRELKTRYKNKQSLKIEKTNAKNAKDVFAGRFHSFYLNDTNQVYSWGMNNHGQLGLGHKQSKANAEKIKYLEPYEGDYVVQVSGGEHHSIVLFKSGCTYSFGRNDEGQIGVGDLFGDHKRKRAQEKLELQQKEEEERLAKEQKEKEEAEMKNEEEKPAVTEEDAKPEGEAEKPAEGGEEAPKEGEPIEEKPKDPSPMPKKRMKRTTSIKEPKQQEEEDLRDIGYFPRPRGNEFLWNFLTEEENDELQKKVTQVESAGNYTYALVKSKNEVYSWGMGENYVLGNREDQNEHKPHKLDPRMFEEKQVLQIACGTQHVVALVQDTKETEMPEVDFSTFVKVASQIPVKEPKVPKEGEEEDDELDEDAFELPEFTKTVSLRSTASYKERTSSKTAPVNGGPEKVPEVKASDATTAVQETVAPPKQSIGGKLVSTAAMQVDTQAVSKEDPGADSGVQYEDSPIQMELKETQQNLSQMLSQGKKRTLQEHQDGLEENQEDDDQEDNSEENDDENGNDQEENFAGQEQQETNINENA